MKSIRIVLLFIINFSYSQQCLEKYIQVPQEYMQTSYCYQFIVPDKNYKDFTVIKRENDYNNIIYETKKKIVEIENFKENIENGFFSECEPLGCFTYIIADFLGKKTVINTPKGLKKFIGRVDNLAEAILIARTYGFKIDVEDKRGGAYLIKKKYIKLFLAQYNNCPFSSTSYFIEINRESGEVKFSNQGLYYESKDCFSY